MLAFFDKHVKMQLTYYFFGKSRFLYPNIKSRKKSYTNFTAPFFFVNHKNKKKSKNKRYKNRRGPNMSNDSNYNDASNKDASNNDFKFPELILEETLYTLEQLKDAAPESAHIALAGRSNVGKSSLINALAKRKQLAKVSSSPGKTRSVNLYRVNPQNLFLTDLPGYGYAKRSKTERELWGNLIEKYMLECENLVAVAILLDCRLDPQEVDKMMVQFALANNIPIIPVLTKADKCTQKERSLRQSQWSVLIPKMNSIPVSAHNGLGLADLWRSLIDAAAKSSYAKELNREHVEKIIGKMEYQPEESEEIIEVNTVPPTTKTKARTKRGAVAKGIQTEAEKQKQKQKISAQAEKSRMKRTKK